MNPKPLLVCLCLMLLVCLAGCDHTSNNKGGFDEVDCWIIGAENTATEAVLGGIEQAIWIGWPLEVRHLGNVGSWLLEVR